MPWIKKIHRWMSVAISLQLIIWLISGLVLNTIDHQAARGKQYQVSNITTSNNKTNLFDLKSLLDTYPKTIEVKLISIIQQPYYLLTIKKALYQHFSQQYHLIDAISGDNIVVDKAFAKRIARASYKGNGEISAIHLLEHSSDFPRQQNPSWQVVFADDLATKVYIEQGSGRVIGHSNSKKRFADFFLMLHFMDYGRAGGFNNIQVIIVSFLTLWLTLSGVVWVIYPFHFKMQNFSLKKKRQR